MTYANTRVHSTPDNRSLIQSRAARRTAATPRTPVERLAMVAYVFAGLYLLFMVVGVLRYSSELSFNWGMFFVQFVIAVANLLFASKAAFRRP